MIQRVAPFRIENLLRCILHDNRKITFQNAFLVWFMKILLLIKRRMTKKSIITMYFKGRDDNIVIWLTILFLPLSKIHVYLVPWANRGKFRMMKTVTLFFPTIFRSYEDERGVHDVRKVLFIHQFHILINWWIFLKHEVVELK